MPNNDISAIIDGMEKTVLQVIVNSIKKPKAQAIVPPPSPQQTITTKEYPPLDKFRKVKELLQQVGLVLSKQEENQPNRILMEILLIVHFSLSPEN